MPSLNPSQKMPIKGRRCRGVLSRGTPLIWVSVRTHHPDASPWPTSPSLPPRRLASVHPYSRCSKAPHLAAKYRVSPLALFLTTVRVSLGSTFPGEVLCIPIHTPLSLGEGSTRWSRPRSRTRRGPGGAGASPHTSHPCCKQKSANTGMLRCKNTGGHLKIDIALHFDESLLLLIIKEKEV